MMLLLVLALSCTCCGKNKTEESTGDPAVQTTAVEEGTSDQTGAETDAQGVTAAESAAPSGEESTGAASAETTATEEKRKNETTAAKSTEADIFTADEDYWYKASEPVSVEWVTYTDTDGLFTMQIPKDWIVTSQGSVLGRVILAFDPENFCRQVVYCDCLQGYTNQETAKLVKDQAGIDINVFTTVKELISEAGRNTFNYTDFTVIEDVGTSATGEVYQGTLYSNGTQVECLATAHLTRTEGVYVGSTLVELIFGDGFQMITTEPEEFSDWAPVLSKCMASITFTDKFWSGRASEWAQIQGTEMGITKESNNIKALQECKWDDRTNDYDIRAQEARDIAYGFERYLDTVTGDVYRAVPGVMDAYTGTRYQRVTAGSAEYNKSIIGYICKD